jgi:hypothetical protein
VPLRGLDSLRARARRSTICLVTKTYRPEINGAAITLGRWCGGLRQRGHVVPIVRPRRLPADSAGPSQDPLIMLMPAAPVLGYPGSGSAGRSCVCPSRRQVPGLEDRDSFSFVSAKGPSVTDSFPFRYLTGGGAPGALERLPAVEVTALAKFVAVGEARVHQRVALAFRQRFPALLVEVPQASEFHRVPRGFAERLGNHHGRLADLAVPCAASQPPPRARYSWTTATSWTSSVRLSATSAVSSVRWASSTFR